MTLNFKILPLVMISPDGKPIDVVRIRRICELGLDECPPDDRAAAWLVLSGALPPRAEEWAALKTDRTREYGGFIEMVSMQDYETKFFPNSSDPVDFGLANQDLMELIHGDVVRTAHHAIFFPGPDPSISSDEPEDFLLPYHVQLRRLERILYIFATLNPTLSYLQGFNELSAVIFYTYSMAMPFFDNDIMEVEAFVFYTFQQMFAETKINELFTTQDKSSLIHRQMHLFMDLLKRHLPEAHEIITGHDIHPLYFCYRWLNLLFAQEQMMPNLVLLWDALFSHFDELVEYASYIAVAQVKLFEKSLDPEDYITTLTT
jgi:hypothetical protein